MLKFLIVHFKTQYLDHGGYMVKRETLYLEKTEAEIIQACTYEDDDEPPASWELCDLYEYLYEHLDIEDIEAVYLVDRQVA